jgi:hypothetical protein
MISECSHRLFYPEPAENNTELLCFFVRAYLPTLTHFPFTHIVYATVHGLAEHDVGVAEYCPVAESHV